ncbi:MAG TPA: hypothetical protein VF693_03465 [Allosphingosinicella sp.]|jgi:uncharacterized membrane protein
MPVPLASRTAAAAALLLAGCGGGEGNGSAANEAASASPPANSAARSSPAAAAPAPATPAAAPAPSAPPAPQPRSGPWSATGYAFNGTEPFWGGSVTGTTIRYMTPEDQFGDVVETEVAYSADSETYRGRYRGRPFVLALARGACSDGMSDRTYAFTATLELLGETRRGCADPQ